MCVCVGMWYIQKYLYQEFIALTTLNLLIERGIFTSSQASKLVNKF